MDWAWCWAIVAVGMFAAAAMFVCKWAHAIAERDCARKARDNTYDLLMDERRLHREAKADAALLKMSLDQLKAKCREMGK